MDVQVEDSVIIENTGQQDFAHPGNNQQNLSWLSKAFKKI